MKTYGDNDRGFEFAVDQPNRQMTLRAWGFWKADLVEIFKDKMNNSISEFKGSKWDLLFDFSEFRPQKTEILEVFENIIIKASNNGLERVAVVVSSAITRLQIMRFAELTKKENWSFHVEQEEAARALSGAKKGFTFPTKVTGK
ncbi:hypothetical protein JXQ70_11775 [bacterium]|nr:hypothetical protein [bacterium]